MCVENVRESGARESFTRIFTVASDVFSKPKVSEKPLASLQIYAQALRHFKTKELKFMNRYIWEYIRQYLNFFLPL